MKREDKICSKCGTKNPSENSFCEKCGSSEFKDPNKPKIVTNTDKQKIADRKYKLLPQQLVAAGAVDKYTVFAAFAAIAFIIIGLWDNLSEDKTHSYSSTPMSTNLSDNDTDSAECDYDKAIEYLNREDPNQLDPEQAENLKSCVSNNLSLYYKGVTLYCQNGVDSFIIDSSYNVSLIADTAFFTKEYNMVAASSCRP